MKKDFASIEEKVIYQKLTGHLLEGNGKAGDPFFEDADDAGFLPNGQDASFGEPEKMRALIRDIGRNLTTMNNTRENPAYRPLYASKRLTGPLVVFCKKVMRRLMKWYIEPPCFQQTEFNGAVVSAIQKLSELQRMQFGLSMSLKEEAARQSREYADRLAEINRAAEEKIQAASLEWEKKYQEIERRLYLSEGTGR